MDGHEQMLQQIGLNILHYRKKQGMTQQQLADAVAYSKNHIQQIETAKATPSLIVLLDIAAALGIPPARLLEER